MPDVPMHVMVSVVSLLGFLLSLSIGALKARVWVKETAIEAIQSQEGRSNVLAIAADRQVRIEDKLDALGRSVDSVANRLESRIDNMQTNMTSQISKLDAETRQLEVRLVRIEQNGGRHG